MSKTMNPPNLQKAPRLGLAVFFLAAAGLFASPFHGWAQEADNVRTVERVIDAETLVVKGGQVIRLIGVHAPSPLDDAHNGQFLQTHQPAAPDLAEKGREAKEFVKFLVEGKQVRLEVDPDHAPFRHRDREDRILAYVWFVSPIFSEPPDWLVIDPSTNDTHDAFLNAAVIRGGYGAVHRAWPFTLAGKFLALELEAKQSERGIWAREGAKEESADGQPA